MSLNDFIILFKAGIFRSREPAVHYIFFVIANIVKQSVQHCTIAMTKKDAATIRARVFNIQTEQHYVLPFIFAE
mgnify:FL=1